MMTRRHFLRGVGGAMLALPTLPSLLTAKEARAQSSVNNRCFVAMLTLHGGVWVENMYPADASLTTTQSYATAGFQVRAGALTPSVNGGTASLSPVLSAPSTRLTPALAAKMNVLRGLDIPYQIAHHDGRAALGNLSQNDDTINPLQGQDRRSIDQVMAWSPHFYQSLSGVLTRSISISQNSAISYGYSNPSAGSGSIQGVDSTASDSLALFDALFPTPPSSGPPATRPPIVDLVYQSYARLRNGNKRLSAADKRRLDDHMQRIADLQRRLKTTTAPQCNQITRPQQNNASILATHGYDGTPALNVQYFQLYNDVIAAALHCGATRIAVFCGDYYVNTFSTVPSASWHDGIAHHVDTGSVTQAGAIGGQTEDSQKTMAAAQRLFFSDVALDLAQKLDAADEGNGTTTLDRCFMMWAQEHSNISHDAYSIPVVTFGSAGGAIKTGRYCDYRNLGNMISPGDSDPQARVQAPGLTWHQLLGTALQAVGVPRSEYQEPQHNGYGAYVALPAQHWPQATWNAAGDILPFLS